MSTNSAEPLDDVDPSSVTPDAVNDADVRAALSSPDPLVRRRGVAVCESLAEAGVDHVEPFLDDVAALTEDDRIAVMLGAIAVLDEVAATDPDALDGRTGALVAATDSEYVDVALTASVALGKLVVERPALVAPYTSDLVAALRETELDENPPDYGETIANDDTRKTIHEHEQAERQRRVSARRTLANVVVAVAEERPEGATDAVDDLVTLLDDVDPSVIGGAVDALGELAAVDPDAVDPVADELIDCLDHYHTSVRGRAIRALGRLGDDRAVEPLRRLAEEDADENVRDVAAETADYLADAT